MDAHLKTMRSPNDMDVSLARCDRKDERAAVARASVDSQVTSAELVAEQGISLQRAGVEPSFA